MPSANPHSLTLGPSKPFSISLGSKAKPQATSASKPTPLNTKKRPRSALADPDSDHEDEVHGALETVTGFDAGKAISAADSTPTKAPLVIKAERNRDWREEARKKRGKNLLPAQVQAAQNGPREAAQEAGSTVERSEVSTEAGLKLLAARKADADGDSPMTNTDQPPSKQSADEEAIAALLGAQKQSTLTIPSRADNLLQPNGATQNEADQEDDEEEEEQYTTESARFRADVDSRPPPATLSDYAAVPVEEFGAAILRGLGWKDGMAVGRQQGGKPEAPLREAKRRPALLGIGAKETAPGEELGAWGGGKGKEKVVYNPVMMRDVATGEVVTEEEVELRKVEAKKRGTGTGKGEEDWRERRERNLRVDGERKEGRRGEEEGEEDD